MASELALERTVQCRGHADDHASPGHMWWDVPGPCAHSCHFAPGANGFAEHSVHCSPSFHGSPGSQLEEPCHIVYKIVRPDEDLLQVETAWGGFFSPCPRQAGHSEQAAGGARAHARARTRTHTPMHTHTHTLWL